jgi:cytochrome c556
VKRLLALLALAALAAGCGGTSRLSADAYKARLATISKQADKAQHDVEQGLQAKTVAELHSRLAAFAAADDKLGDDVAALEPPKDAEQANAALARAEHDNADAVRALLPRIANARTPTAALQLVQHDPGAAKVGGELDSALSRLRKLGYTTGS